MNKCIGFDSSSTHICFFLKNYSNPLLLQGPVIDGSSGNEKSVVSEERKCLKQSHVLIFIEKNHLYSFFFEDSLCFGHIAELFFQCGFKFCCVHGMSKSILLFITATAQHDFHGQTVQMWSQSKMPGSPEHIFWIQDKIFTFALPI